MTEFEGRPRRAFKFVEREFAERLVQKGELLLRPLHDFQRSEFAAGIRDEREGVIKYRVPRVSQEKSDRLLSAALREVPLPPPPLQALFGEGSKVDVQSPAAMTFCMTSLVSSEVRGSLPATYDACVEITDLLAFERLIAAQLDQTMAVWKSDTRRVMYGPLVPNLRLAAIKPRVWFYKPIQDASGTVTYAHQAEIRSVWMTRRRPEMKVITVPELVKCVRLVNLAEPPASDLVERHIAVVDSDGSVTLTALSRVDELLRTRRGSSLSSQQ